MSGPVENLYDVIVIGAGPVGYTVAARARAAGLSVAAVERELVGGECSYWAGPASPARRCSGRSSQSPTPAGSRGRGRHSPGRLTPRRSSHAGTGG